MIKVAHCILGYFPQVGGAENQARLLISKLVKRHVKVTVFTRKYAGDFVADSEVGSDIVRSWRASGIASKEISSLIIALRLIWRRRDFDIFHVHQINVLAFFVTLAGTIANRPVMIKVANSGPKFDLNTLAKRHFGKFMVNFIIKSDARFIALSEPIVDMLLKSGIETRRISTIPNGVLFASADKSKHAISNVGFIGRLENVKRPGIFLELSKRFPNLNFHVFGEGSLRAMLASDCEESGAHNLTFHGNLSDTDKIYSLLDLIVHPSESEGMSNTLLESIAYGIRCVVTSLPENIALFGDCTSIVEYVDGGEVELWECAIIKSMGKTYESVLADRKQLLRKYDIEHVADRYLNFYKDIISE